MTDYLLNDEKDVLANIPSRFYSPNENHLYDLGFIMAPIAIDKPTVCIGPAIDTPVSVSVMAPPDLSLLDKPEIACKDFPSPLLLDKPDIACKDFPSPLLLDKPEIACKDFPSPLLLDKPEIACKDFPGPQVLDLTKPTVCIGPAFVGMDTDLDKSILAFVSTGTESTLGSHASADASAHAVFTPDMNVASLLDMAHQAA